MSTTGSAHDRTRGRLRRLIGELAKFGTVGGLGVLVNLGAFNICRAVTGLAVVRCSIIATVVAIAFNYAGLRYFTYRDRERGSRTRELLLFAAFSAVGLVIENGVLYVATYAFDLNGPIQNNFWKFLGIGTATLFRFWTYRSVVFKLPAPAETPVIPVQRTAAPAPAPRTEQAEQVR
ncbi:GtrA family protein [Streptomyces chrestomyceticus]|uniref:GtrA family protein n=1 Tax=Streptomyces chrestomyceticus TaxID=68185 RepID=A0ABU7WKH3_9ACTN